MLRLLHQLRIELVRISFHRGLRDGTVPLRNAVVIERRSAIRTLLVGRDRLVVQRLQFRRLVDGRQRVGLVHVRDRSFGPLRAAVGRRIFLNENRHRVA